MDKENITNQINTLNEKVDLILEYVNRQRLKSIAMDDLVADLSIVGKDLYDTMVTELDDNEVEIRPEDLRILGIKLLKNIKNFISIIDLIESASDFGKDALPIINETIINLTQKFKELDKSGHFKFIKEWLKIIDNIMKTYSPEDVRQLSENITTILETIRNFTQPDMLKSVNNAIQVFKSIEIENAPEYSLWKLIREINKPEMRKALGFMVLFIKNLSGGISK